DIHGCFEEYLRLEEKIIKHAKKNHVRPFIISVGDIIDRGPDSKGLIDHFMRGRKDGTHEAVMGNHESFMLCYLECFTDLLQKRRFPSWLSTYRERFERGALKGKMSWEDYSMTLKSLWLDQGGRETLLSYGLDPEDDRNWSFPNSHLRFLLNLRPLFEVKKAIVTHALPIKEDLLNVRSFFESRKRVTSKIKDSIYSLLWSRSMQGVSKIKGKTLVSGHTPLPKTMRHKKEGVIQIDTGCYAGQRLTAWCPDADKIIFVRAKKRYF
ncbi:MAG: metallophosphoesterase, partial [Bdellovibrionota bacterium]|nr:metallophosphoesterase [Bdellovibrionota bacterium]